MTLDTPTPTRSWTTSDVRGCARCGGTHLDVRFAPINEQRPDGYTHVGICPATGSPILVQVVSLC